MILRFCITGINKSMKREKIIKYTSDNLLEIIKGRKVYVKMSSWMQEIITKH